jgi:hypothetical protein
LFSPPPIENHFLDSSVEEVKISPYISFAVGKKFFDEFVMVDNKGACCLVKL